MTERTKDHELAEIIAGILPHSAAANAIKVFEQCQKEGKKPAILLEDRRWIVVHDLGRDGPAEPTQKELM